MALPETESLVPLAASGDRRALARLITLVEESRFGAGDALSAAFAAARPAHRIGLTGSPGAILKIKKFAQIMTAMVKTAAVTFFRKNPFKPNFLISL